MRGSIPQSLVLLGLAPTSWFLPGITNAGCRVNSTHMGVCGVTSLPAMALWKGWVDMRLEAMLWAWKPHWLMAVPPPPSLSFRGHRGVLPGYLQQWHSDPSMPPTPLTPQVGSCIQAPPVTSWAAVLPSSGPGSMGLSRATSGQSRTRTTGYTVGAGGPVGRGGTLLPAGESLGPALGPELRGLAPFSLLGGSTDKASGGTHAPACTLWPDHQEWGFAF